MSSKLKAMFEAQSEDVIKKIILDKSKFTQLAKEHGLFSIDEFARILTAKGDPDELAKELWEISLEATLADWKHYWKIMLILLKLGMWDQVEMLLPSHYHPKADVKILTDSEVAKIEAESGTIKLLDKAEWHWLTNSSSVRDLVIALRDAADDTIRITFITTYLDKLESLKSLHPADDGTKSKDGLRSTDDSGNPPPKPPKPPPKPDKKKSNKTLIIVIVVIAVVIAVLIVLMLFAGTAYMYSDSGRASQTGKKRSRVDYGSVSIGNTRSQGSMSGPMTNL